MCDDDRSDPWPRGGGRSVGRGFPSAGRRVDVAAARAFDVLAAGGRDRPRLVDHGSAVGSGSGVPSRGRLREAAAGTGAGSDEPNGNGPNSNGERRAVGRPTRWRGRQEALQEVAHCHVSSRYRRRLRAEREDVGFAPAVGARESVYFATSRAACASISVRTKPAGSKSTFQRWPQRGSRGEALRPRAGRAPPCASRRVSSVRRERSPWATGRHR